MRMLLALMLLSTPAMAADIAGGLSGASASSSSASIASFNGATGAVAALNGEASATNVFTADQVSSGEAIAIGGTVSLLSGGYASTSTLGHSVIVQHSTASADGLSAAGALSGATALNGSVAEAEAFGFGGYLTW